MESIQGVVFLDERNLFYELEPVGNMGIHKWPLEPVYFESMFNFLSINHGFANVSILLTQDPTIIVLISLPVQIEFTIKIELAVKPAYRTAHINLTVDIMRIVRTVHFSRCVVSKALTKCLNLFA